MKSTITIIIPNFNHGHLLPGYIGSWLAQDPPPDEIIVIDDASTDGSLQILKDFKPYKHRESVSVVANPVNVGAAASTTRGIKLASGDYVYTGAADDAVFPGFIAKMKKALDDNPGVGLAMCRTKMVDVATGLHYNRGMQLSCGVLHPLDICGLVKRDHFLMSATGVLWRRLPLLDVGGHRRELRWHADWFAFFAVAFRYGIAVVPETLAQFNQDNASYSGAGMKRRDEQERIFNTAMSLLAEPQFADVAPLFKESGVFGPFGLRALWQAVNYHPEMLSWPFVRLAFWWSLRARNKKHMPKWAVKAYYRRIGVL